MNVRWQMTMILVCAVVGGLVAHQTRRFTEMFAPGWQDLLRDAIGVLGMLPFGSALFRRNRRRWNGDSYDIAYLLTALAFGSGVIAGYIIDRFMEKK